MSVVKGEKFIMMKVKSLFALNPNLLRSGLRCKSDSFLGKRGDILEEEYFHKQRQKQLEALKKKRINEKDFIAEQVKKHQEAIDYHKRMIDDYKSGKKLDETMEKMWITKSK